MREVTIDTGALSTLYVSSPVSVPSESPVVRKFLHHLDSRKLELVSSLTNEQSDVARLLTRCGGMVAVLLHNSMDVDFVRRDLQLAGSLGLPALSVLLVNDKYGHIPPDLVSGALIYDVEEGKLRDDGQYRFEAFLGQARHVRPVNQSYVFLAVRIHRDFDLVRVAIGDAVENTLGIPCVWFDDPRVITAQCGVRERTQLMIRNCTLFVADITHGPNNPDHDSPNTAHEIGMALAYDRPVILSCQEPRRDLYFSAGDLHTFFWVHEQHLNEGLAACLRSRYSVHGRKLLNRELPSDSAGFSGSFPAYRFEMDWSRRYVMQSPRPSPSASLPMLPEISDYLNAVRRCPGAWRAVWHPLGYIDIEIFADGTDYLRLHIWSEIEGSYRRTGFSIHKHDWSMSSHVICGVICNRTYEVFPDALPTHRVYGVEYNGDVNHLVATGETVRCELRQEQSVHSGKTYTLAPAVFHDIAVPADVTTATLVRGIRHEGLRNQVLGDLNAEDRLETSRIACDDASVQRAIDLVLAARRNLG